jgi:hypothetical protein
MRTFWISLIVLFSLVLAGCGGAAVMEEPATPATRHEIPSATPGNPIQSGTAESIDMPANPPPVEKFIALSKKDLAERLQIDDDRIAMVKTEEIVWPDAALGCPSPGMVYAQGRVPGYRIWLTAQGREYIYHTDLNGLVILCPEQEPDNGSSGSPGSGPTPNIGVPID